jgi:hypothetical protein
MLNPDDFVYLPSLVVKELLAGREVEITGGMCTHFTTAADYKKRKADLTGKFGEVINDRPDRKRTLVATRNPPPWALQIIHEHIWERKEMEQWKIPEVFR